MDESYSKKVLDLIRHPKNMGVIKNADGVGMVGNPICGDIMKIYIKVGRNKGGEEMLKNIKFQTLGCGAAIASSSILTSLVKGQSLSKAEKISAKDLAHALDGLPQVKMHCSVLADQALKKAIKNYRIMVK
jgi:nitrogen fixation protein NifU and related proteins